MILLFFCITKWTSASALSAQTCKCSHTHTNVSVCVYLGIAQY